MVAKCFYCGGQNVTVAHIKSCSTVSHKATKPGLVLAASPADLADKMVALTTPAAPVKVEITAAVPEYKVKIAAMKAKWAAEHTQPAAVPQVANSGDLFLAQIEALKTVAAANPNISLGDGIALAATTSTPVAPVASAAPAAAAKVLPQDMEIGFYFKDGEAYKIIWNKSQTKKYAEKLYVKKTWNSKGELSYKGSWGYAPGSIYDLQPEHKMSKEIADNYAATTLEKYGVSFCCICGKKLTAKESVAKGIGPVCAGKI